MAGTVHYSVCVCDREVVVAGGAGTFEALGARAAGPLAEPLAPLLAELLLCAPELRATRDDLRAFRTQVTLCILTNTHNYSQSTKLNRIICRKLQKKQKDTI